MRTAALLLLSVCLLLSQTDVLTANYDNDRTSSTLNETVLNTSNVNPDRFGKLYAYPVDGQVYAQPLYVAGLDIEGTGPRNVLYVATLHNSVYAFDANAGPDAPPIWHVNFGDPVDPASLVASDGTVFGDIKREIGILSTPVIDRSNSALYVVHETRNKGKIQFLLHALDLVSGAEKLNGPVEINAGVPGTGWPGGNEAANGKALFRPQDHIQRPGLLLANGSVYVAFGSHGDMSPWHGWIMAYDAADLSKQTAAFSTTPDGWGGSVWQGGRGLAADANGDLYITTGNGWYDGRKNWSQSMLHLDAALHVLDWFTPADWKPMNNDDIDVGSSGPILITGTNLVVAGSKDGKVSVADRSNMGHESPNDSQILQQFQAAQDPVFGIFNMAFWKRRDDPLLYVWGFRDALRAFRMDKGMFVAESVSANNSVQTDLPMSGMAVSSNGSVPGAGILWVTSTSSTDKGFAAALHAFDATDVSRELWNSDMRGSRDTLGYFTKFANPTVANGRVYVPTDSNQVVVYGLLGTPGIDVVVNSASFRSSYVSGGELVTVLGKDIGSMTGPPSVTFNGVPAPLLYVAPNQINVAVPFSASAAGSTELRITSLDRETYSSALPVASAAPGIFSADSSGSGQGAILNQDLSSNSASNPAARGSAISLFATGAGPLSPAVSDGTIPESLPLPAAELPIQVRIGGTPATVIYQGAAIGMIAGVVQINVRVPATLNPGPSVPVTLTVAGVPTGNVVTVAVK